MVRFASSVLKRALSESFAGVPVQEGEPLLFGTEDWQQNHKIALAVRSLSLELARQKSRRLLSVSFTTFQNFYRFFKDISKDKIFRIWFTLKKAESFLLFKQK